MKRRLKINGLIIFLVFILLILFPAVFLRSAKEGYWDAAAELLGIVFIIFGQILRASARGYKSENSGNGHSLIHGGPYALVRNPMYLGILFIGLGIVLALFNWWVAVLFLCIFIWRYQRLIFKEEEKLLAMFPGAYQDYQQRVSRLLPSVAAVLQKDMAEYLPLKLLWLKKEIGSILAVLLLVLFLEGWKDCKGAGVRIYLKEAILFFAIVILFIFFIIYLIRRTNNPQKDASNKSKNTL
ncbi:MAG: isoprenylcysteine carboxylmethyltransferase family protein [Candidatus Omnitrophota bacterium]|nr:isoprenylcysteine carboxylmethyltransferase family protein [Candidatus Omnitrophota bacterium]